MSLLKDIIDYKTSIDCLAHPFETFNASL